jgi:hypothetical protein
MMDTTPKRGETVQMTAYIWNENWDHNIESGADTWIQIHLNG